MSGWADCPRCQARGEVVDYINEWGKAEPRPCTLCDGKGEVTADVAADYLAEVAPMSDDWKPGDIVLSQRTGGVLEFLGRGFKNLPRWRGLSPAAPDVEGWDPAEPVLLARRHGDKRLPVLDLERMAAEPRCYHVGGATWQGKCIDCGTVCAPNLDDVAVNYEPWSDALQPYFGPEDGAE